MVCCPAHSGSTRHHVTQQIRQRKPQPTTETLLAGPSTAITFSTSCARLTPTTRPCCYLALVRPPSSISRVLLRLISAIVVCQWSARDRHGGRPDRLVHPYSESRAGSGVTGVRLANHRRMWTLLAGMLDKHHGIGRLVGMFLKLLTTHSAGESIPGYLHRMHR